METVDVLAALLDVPSGIDGRPLSSEEAFVLDQLARNAANSTPSASMLLVAAHKWAEAEHRDCCK